MPSRKMSNEELLAFAAGEMNEADAGRVESWLETHPDARKLVDRYRRISTLHATDDSVAPPPEVTARARAIFTPAPARPKESWLDRVDALIASLIFDSRVQPASVRYADTENRFQLAFETRAADIDLQAERIQADASAPRWQVTGQVVADEAGRLCRVALAPAGRRTPTGEAIADESGMFYLEIAPGTYDVYLELTDQVVVLPGVEIR
jgi:anti-sigma factor RsiW